MITSMHIENFKCFKDFNIDLGPFNVLIGPNDSGKTAFMQAVRLVGAADSNGFREAPEVVSETHGTVEGLGKKLGTSFGDEIFWRCEPSNTLSISVNALKFSDYGNVKPRGTIGHYFDVRTLGKDIFWTIRFNEIESPFKVVEHSSDWDWASKWFSEVIGNVSYYRFDPLLLRKSSMFGQEMTMTGDGFPALLDYINRDDTNVYKALEKEFCEKFQYYKTLKRPLSEDKKKVKLSFQTIHKEVLPADSVSDGVMLSLAYMALSHQPNPPKILLIEEPENGVHHGSLEQIVKTLRSLAEEKNVQIIMTTHSPYLLDCVKPKDVRVFAKGDDGAVRAAKLSDHPDVEDMKKYFRAGEIWTEFDEADVVANGGTPSE